MSSDDDARDMVPWEDLSANQRTQFMHMLQEAGLDVDVERRTPEQSVDD